MEIRVGRVKTKEEFVEVVKMQRAALEEIYHFAEPSDYKTIASFLKEQLESGDADIFVSFDVNDPKIITGFAYGTLVHSPLFKSKIYSAEIVYVKPEFRKTKSAWLLAKALEKAGKMRADVTMMYLFADNSRPYSLPTLGKRFARGNKPFIVGMYVKKEQM